MKLRNSVFHIGHYIRFFKIFFFPFLNILNILYNPERTTNRIRKKKINENMLYPYYFKWARLKTHRMNT